MKLGSFDAFLNEMNESGKKSLDREILIFSLFIASIYNLFKPNDAVAIKIFVVECLRNRLIIATYCHWSTTSHHCTADHGKVTTLFFGFGMLVHRLVLTYRFNHLRSTILRAKLSFEIYREKNIAIFLTSYISSQ